MKLTKKVPFALLIAIFLGLVPPLAFFLMMLNSCPHSGDLMYIPFISYQCPGEFIGTLGLFLTALPAILVVVFFVIFAASHYESTGRHTPLVSQFTPTAQLIFMVVLAALVNIFSYWLIIKFLLMVMKKMSKATSKSNQLQEY
jgi:hypothetical protein